MLRELDALGPPLAAVHGNVDTGELRRLLPAERVVAAGLRGSPWCMMPAHGAGGSSGCGGGCATARTRWCSGTRTCPLHETHADGFQIFNPGSPTDAVARPTHTMGIARVEGGRVAFALVTLG